MKSTLCLLVLSLLSLAACEIEVATLSITGGPCTSGVQCTTRTCKSGVCVRGEILTEKEKKKMKKDGKDGKDGAKDDEAAPAEKKLRKKKSVRGKKAKKHHRRHHRHHRRNRKHHRQF